MDHPIPHFSPPSASPFNGWLWKMAWRDSRRSRRRLFLFMSAIVLGIAALVAINSFGDNLARSVDEQAQELLGADLVLSAGKEIGGKLGDSLRTMGQERSTEVAFASMAYFPKTGGTRLAQVKALEGGFPYYGAWDVQPAASVAQFRKAGEEARPVALVDDALLIQFGAKPGDSVKIGNVTFRVAGRVLSTPGQTAIATTVAPTVFIPAQFLKETGLLGRGSRASYRIYYRFADTDTTNVERLATAMEPRLDRAGISLDTVDRRKQQTSRIFADLTKFLNLVAFVALLLGCVGVASAVQLYVKEKVASVAVLRCLGASGRQALLIYLIQTAGMGLLGAIVGTALGAAVQLLLPDVFGSFLPIEVTVGLSWKAITQGLVTGLVISLLFALLPLLAIRNVSPLRTLRVSDDSPSPRDPLRWLLGAVIVAFIGGFAYWQTRNWKLALSFTAGLVVTFGVLALLSQLLIWAVRRFFPVSWSYVWRQGLANLFRPQNQTLVLVSSIGLGTFLIATLYLIQTLLLGRVALSASGSQPNMVLFDIQNEQQEGVKGLLDKHRLPQLQNVPVVTMRMAEYKGRLVDELVKDTTSETPRGAISREYRVTYRDSLIESEQLTAGKMPFVDEAGTAHISIEDGFLKRLKLKLGDSLTFNVQGALIPVVVGGTRTVDWNRVQTNFLVVFPKGVLEKAPQFHVVMTRVTDPVQASSFQRDLVINYPNVSAIDLALILKTLDDIVAKIAFVIRFMALFSILTGLLVLGSSVVISKYQRMQESVLLRTLGANRAQILKITLVEYLFLGALAAAAGIGLALLGTWPLATLAFDLTYTPNFGPLLLGAAGVAALTMLIGAFNSRAVLNRSPLEVLRAEG